MSYAISIFKTYYPSVCLLLCFPKNLTIFMVLTSIYQLLSARCQAGKTRNSFSYYFPSISFPKCSKWTPKSYFKGSYEQRYTSTWKPTSWWILGMTQKQLKKQRFCIIFIDGFPAESFNTQDIQIVQLKLSFFIIFFCL